MKIAVTGPRGRLASWLIAHHGCAPLECDILDFEQTRIEIHRVEPDVVIHAAAYTKVDRAEVMQEEALKINLRGTGNVRTSFNGYMVYLSTAYIFDGQSKKPYKEEGIAPNPIQHYGWTKWVGEAAMLAGDGPNLTVRTMSLYTPASAYDFVKGIVKSLKLNKHQYLPIDLYSNPTYVPHLALGILKAIELQLTGVLNIAGRDVVNRYEWAEAIARKFKLNLDLLHQSKYTSPNEGTLRPRMAGLDVSKAIAHKVPVFPMKKGLREMEKRWDREI